jgi:hypothetical protein
MSVISLTEKYLDNSLEALMDLKTGTIVYFVNSQIVEIDVLSQENVCMFIILNALGVGLLYEKQMLDKI